MTLKPCHTPAPPQHATQQCLAKLQRRRSTEPPCTEPQRMIRMNAFRSSFRWPGYVDPKFTVKRNTHRQIHQPRAPQSQSHFYAEQLSHSPTAYRTHRPTPVPFDSNLNNKRHRCSNPKPQTTATVGSSVGTIASKASFKEECLVPSSAAAGAAAGAEVREGEGGEARRITPSAHRLLKAAAGEGEEREDGRAQLHGRTRLHQRRRRGERVEGGGVSRG